MPAAWAQSTAASGGDAPPVLTPDDYPPVADTPEPASTAAAQNKNTNGTPPAATNQDVPPVTDQPGQPQAATAAPTPLSGAAGDLVAPLPPPSSGIQVQTLGSVEGPPVGLLDTVNGGLGMDMWSGSARGNIESLMARVPLVSPDPVIRALAKRIVLTKAAAPLGNAKRAIVTLRIEKLLDAGLIDEAGALAAQASLPDDPDFARVQADALLTANRAADVCGNLTTARLSSGEPFWLELRLYCAAVGGDEATAELTHEVMQAQGDGDRAFDTLADDVLNHKTVMPGAIAHPTAMHLFLLQQAGLAVPGAVAAAMGTSANLLAMRDPRNAPAVRMAAAERIVATGAASIEQLRNVADAQDIKLDQMANAAADANSLPFFAAQVLLRRAAVIQTRPDMQAQLVYEALALGEKANLLPLAAAFQGDVAASVGPSAANPAMASLFARALLLAHNPQAAARWLTNKDLLQPVLDLAAPNPTRDAAAQASLAAYVTGLVKNPPVPDANRSYKALLIGITDVLGRPLPPEAKAQAPALEAMRWDGNRPDSGEMRLIEQASLQPERKGEALLRILDAIHDIGLRDLAPDTTIEFVRLLGAMGLPRAAHDLGMDALVLYVAPPQAPASVSAAR
ncbi:MAG: hypothetical protein KGJ79_12225 [Alphaproteobacteria bacterium]|nr:hypothetical protein [Alphaproteobacteria bacterium]MDE2111901.1 hypothetical protein [Alphaproteobacteria bacterium]MDE2494324.1 hypothetical protein [Alphaproteobacteria bacterium]